MRKILIGFTLHSFILTSPLFAATSHAADNNMRPGLWQIITTSDSVYQGYLFFRYIGKT